MMEDNIIQQAQEIATTHASKDRSLEIVQDLVMHSQPKEENWHFVSTHMYEFPDRRIWIVMLWREIGLVSDGRLEVRMKAEMVVGEEDESGKRTYVLKTRSS